LATFTPTYVTPTVPVQTAITVSKSPSVIPIPPTPSIVASFPTSDVRTIIR
jgi:hypothetical protein